ncbi:MAG: PucR family transcriptional regulator [Solirubrobacterales bacterium]
MNSTSAGNYRRNLASQLRGSAAELEEAILDRISALEEATTDTSPLWVHNVRELIRGMLRHAFESIELNDYSLAPPPVVLAHARKAAWSSVPLQKLLSRYIASYSLFKDFLLNNVEGRTIPFHFRQLAGSTDRAFERLIEAVGNEYQRELETMRRTSTLRQLDQVKALLRGDLLGAPDLPYDFGATHIGLIATGDNAAAVVRGLARNVDGRLLVLRPSPDRLWAWIATREALSHSDLSRLTDAGLLNSVSLAIGDPLPKLVGWRETHRQAVAAFPVALQGQSKVVHHSDVALVASAIRDPLLLNSLKNRYLRPLLSERDGGKALHHTVRTYFALEGNTSSTAAALNVKRHTITNRIREVETRLGRSLVSCSTELDLALQLTELGFIAI